MNLDKIYNKLFYFLYNRHNFGNTKNFNGYNGKDDYARLLEELFELLKNENNTQELDRNPKYIKIIYYISKINFGDTYNPDFIEGLNDYYQLLNPNTELNGINAADDFIKCECFWKSKDNLEIFESFDDLYNTLYSALKEKRQDSYYLFLSKEIMSRLDEIYLDPTILEDESFKLKSLRHLAQTYIKFDTKEKKNFIPFQTSLEDNGFKFAKEQLTPDELVESLRLTIPKFVSKIGEYPNEYPVHHPFQSLVEIYSCYEGLGDLYGRNYLQQNYIYDSFIDHLIIILEESVTRGIKLEEHPIFEALYQSVIKSVEKTGEETVSKRELKKTRKLNHLRTLYNYYSLPKEQEGEIIQTVDDYIKAYKFYKRQTVLDYVNALKGKAEFKAVSFKRYTSAIDIMTDLSNAGNNYNNTQVCVKEHLNYICSVIKKDSEFLENYFKDSENFKILLAFVETFLSKQKRYTSNHDRYCYRLQKLELINSYKM